MDVGTIEHAVFSRLGPEHQSFLGSEDKQEGLRHCELGMPGLYLLYPLGKATGLNLLYPLLLPALLV